MTRREIVRAVENHGRACDQLVELVSIDVLLYGNKDHIRIDRSQCHPARRGLGHADSPGCVKDLALQVGQVDPITIDESQRADPGGCEVQRRGGSQATRANDQPVRCAQAVLTLDAELIEEYVTRIAQ
jgi:hypothetical protein